MAIGTVKKVTSGRGFGLIATEHGARDTPSTATAPTTSAFARPCRSGD